MIVSRNAIDDIVVVPVDSSDDVIDYIIKVWLMIFSGFFSTNVESESQWYQKEGGKAGPKKY